MSKYKNKLIKYTKPIILLLISNLYLTSCTYIFSNRLPIKLNNLGNKNKDFLIEMNRLKEKNPNNPNLYYVLGNIYFENKQFDESLKNYNKAIELDPNNIIYYIIISHNFIAKKDEENAIKYIKIALRMIEEQKNNNLNKITRFSDSLLSKLVRLYFYHISGYSDLDFDSNVLTSLGDGSYEVKLLVTQSNYFDIMTKEDIYTRSFNKNRNLFIDKISTDLVVLLYKRLSKNEVKVNDYKEIIEIASKGLELNSKNDVLYYYKGLSFYNLKDYDNSIKNGFETIKYNKNHYNAYYLIGLSYYHKGLHTESKYYFDKSCSLGQNDACGWFDAIKNK